MTKQILKVAIVLTVFAAMCGTAHATLTPPAPDAGSTSLLLVVAAGGLGVLRKYMR